jgi:tetratricopeptide (TPR) repeat protein
VLKRQTNDFKEAVAYNTLGSEEAREQFSQTALRMSQVNVPPEVPADEKKQLAQAMNDFLVAVKTDIEDTHDLYNEDPRMLSIYGMFYNSIGDPVNAEKILTRAHTIAPNKQLITYDLIRALLMQSKYKEANILAKETYDLAPLNTYSLKWLIISSVYAGSYKEAKAYVLAKHSMIPFDQDTLNAALSAGQTAVAIDMLNDYKKEQPAAAAQIDSYIKQIYAMPRVPVATSKK